MISKNRYNIKMEPKELESYLRSIAIEILGIEPNFYNHESLVKCHGMDSLDAVEMIMHIEKDLNIAIPDEDADKMGDSINSVMEFLMPIKGIRKEKLKKIDGRFK